MTKQRLCICGYPLKANGIECTRPAGPLFPEEAKAYRKSCGIKPPKRKPTEDDFDFG